MIVTKGKSVRVTAMPEDDEEKPTKDLIKVMKSELHDKLEEEEKKEHAD